MRDHLDSSFIFRKVVGVTTFNVSYDNKTIPLIIHLSSDTEVHVILNWGFNISSKLSLIQVLHFCCEIFRKPMEFDPVYVGLYFRMVTDAYNVCTLRLLCHIIGHISVKWEMECCACLLEIRHTSSWISLLNTLRPRQDGSPFANNIFTCIFFNENCCILNKFSLKYVRKGPIDNNPALVQIMVSLRSGDKPLSEPMMISLPTHICVIRPQWVNSSPPGQNWCPFSQTEFSDAFWWMKSFAFWLKFHWSLFLRVQLR